MLFCPLSLSIKSDEAIRCKLSYLFFRYKYDSSDLDKPDINAETSQKTNNKNMNDKNDRGLKKFKKITQKYTIRQFCSIAKIAYNYTRPQFIRIAKKLKIKKFDLYVGIVGNDAADTAHKTAIVSSLLYPFFSLAVNNSNSLKNYNFKIEALFLEEKNKYYADIRIKIPFVSFIVPSLKILLYLSKLIRKL